MTDDGAQPGARVRVDASERRHRRIAMGGLDEELGRADARYAGDD